MKRALLTAALFVSAAGHAAATDNISCTAGDDPASIELLVGTLDVLNVLRAEIVAGDTTLSTDAADASKIVVGQAFGDDEKILIDFTDPNVERIVASVRLFKASEGKNSVTAGTLRVAGAGAFSVDCFGP